MTYLALHGWPVPLPTGQLESGLPSGNSIATDLAGGAVAGAFAWWAMDRTLY